MINQILDGDIRDSLYAANAPSAGNPMATLADAGTPALISTSDLLTKVSIFDDFLDGTPNYTGSVTTVGPGSSISTNAAGGRIGGASFFPVNVDLGRRSWWYLHLSRGVGSVASITLSNTRGIITSQRIYTGVSTIDYEGLWTQAQFTVNTKIIAGLWDLVTTTPGTTPTNGIYFFADGTISPNWLARCSNSGVPTSINTGIPVDTTEHRFKISVNAAGTSATFYIDGVLVATIATNLPATTTGLIVQISHIGHTVQGGTPRRMFIDYLRLRMNFTTPRT